MSSHDFNARIARSTTAVFVVGSLVALTMIGCSAQSQDPSTESEALGQVAAEGPHQPIDVPPDQNPCKAAPVAAAYCGASEQIGASGPSLGALGGDTQHGLPGVLYTCVADAQGAMHAEPTAKRCDLGCRVGTPGERDRCRLSVSEIPRFENPMGHTYAYYPTPHPLTDADLQDPTVRAEYLAAIAKDPGQYISPIKTFFAGGTPKYPAGDADTVYTVSVPMVEGQKPIDQGLTIFARKCGYGVLLSDAPNSQKRPDGDRCAWPTATSCSIHEGCVKRVDVYKSRQWLVASVTKDGVTTPVFEGPVSTGKPDWIIDGRLKDLSTPTGAFNLLASSRRQDMVQFLPATRKVPFITFFYGVAADGTDVKGPALHGTYWHDRFGLEPRSHGCVNLTEWDAEWLYGWLQEDYPYTEARPGYPYPRPTLGVVEGILRVVDPMPFGRFWRDLSEFHDMLPAVEIHD